LEELPVVIDGKWFSAGKIQVSATTGMLFAI
jgi:hypothetical protein